MFGNFEQYLFKVFFFESVNSAIFIRTKRL